MNTDILPLAITMMAGPQIMSAIIFVTTDRAIPVSAAWVAGVALAATAGTAVAIGLAGILGDNVSLGSSSDSGSTGHIIQYVLIAILVALAIRNYVKRETIQPPSWLGQLMAAGPGKAFKTGVLLVFLMPSDIVVMLTVGVNIEHAGQSFVHAIPFIVLTVLIAALPLLVFFLFRRRAQVAMPKVRDWITGNSWLVNIIVCAIFILLIAS